ncbi:MAG: hypothetical protein ABSA90_13440 [Xanthobacteraceae bacterium]|jgi:hypothetical protein
MKVLYVAGVLSVLLATACLADEPITVSGCAFPGVEGRCVILKTADGRVYNISAAKPSPGIGTYGQIKGILKSRAVSTCMQGQIIDPAAWTQTGQRCPF